MTVSHRTFAARDHAADRSHARARDAPMRGRRRWRWAASRRRKSTPTENSRSRRAAGTVHVQANAPARAPGRAGRCGWRRRGGGGGGGGGGADGRRSWTLKSAVVGGRDTLDFPLDVRPTTTSRGAVVTFTDRAQEVTGTLQDSGPSDVRLHDHRVLRRQGLLDAAVAPDSSARPGTDGKFTVPRPAARRLPPHGRHRR